MINISKLLNINLPVILASQSPRRKQLLEQLGFDFEVIPANIDESVNDNNRTPVEFVRNLTLSKANSVALNIEYPSIVIGSDTIVVLNNEILNKPIDNNNAAEMLRKLSGRTHIVYTGIAIVNSKTKKTLTDVQSTEVTFRPIDSDEINAYVQTGSPLDKAGAYGIQDDFGAVFVSHINGCYYNIVGLPLEMLYGLLKKYFKEE